jgi:Tfp pilus assembly protein PilV
MRRAQRTHRGISLVEALVALAVMAFGMLAYVGMQGTLRFNGDVAKQRSEAVRIAQQAIEQWRAYGWVEPQVGSTDYAEISTIAGTEIADVTSNTIFTLTRTVTDAAITAEALLRGAAPRMKTLVVDVSWLDRNGETQSIRVSTTIAAIPPELAGTLAVAGFTGPLGEPLGRNPAIPVPAKNLGNGTSAFKPPGATGATVVFVFDNLTGVIVGVCNTITTGQDQVTGADVQSCSNNANGLPLSGFVRFATDMVDTTTGFFRQPTAADAENPQSTALNLHVQLTLTSTGHASPDHACFADAPLTALTTRMAVPYFCAVFFQPGTVPRWSGISTLIPRAFAEPGGSAVWTIAADADDGASTHYRVCRYTPATSDSQPIPNRWHPRAYSNANALEPLANQNFLVIRAGNDATAFLCPTDVPPDPLAGDFVNSNTLTHQPPPAVP